MIFAEKVTPYNLQTKLCNETLETQSKNNIKETKVKLKLGVKDE